MGADMADKILGCYLELSAEDQMIIAESQVDEYIESMCAELKRKGIYKPEMEFWSQWDLQEILYPDD